VCRAPRMSRWAPHNFEGVSHPIFRKKPNASHMCARITISHIW
jgi:hypothetical protein